MTNQEAIDVLEQRKTCMECVVNCTCEECDEAFDLAIKALEQEPCGKDINVPATDAISRQAVLDGLASIAKAKAKSDAQKSLMGRVMFFTEHLPSVTPQPRMGHWILADEQNKEDVENDNYRFICSECQYSDIHAKGTIVPYCWNCGARMVESQESEVQDADSD